MLQIECSLCHGKAALFHEIDRKKYYKCTNCLSVLLHPAYYISPEEERNRYREHNNDVEDSGYQKFVSPIVNSIKESYNTQHIGLDFGSGTGPVITKLLRDEGYKIELYDPFFCDNPEKLTIQYDYIACCEVIEHFHCPEKEFRLLRSLLKPGGSLFCMTEVYSEDLDFVKWYYKNDSTHVFFYHVKAFNWIKSNLNYSKVIIDKRLITLIA
ncbi:MAG: methyltransferase [Gracilibacter sp. BRH_c7a]|nr:MAG: methyltransferase [Gracilibacter sp. BRH_c7a]